PHTRFSRDWSSDVCSSDLVHQWLKKAVLLSFRLYDMTTISGAPGGASWWDKVPSKFAGMDETAFRNAGFRAVPGAIVRHSAYIEIGRARVGNACGMMWASS